MKENICLLLYYIISYKEAQKVFNKKSENNALPYCLVNSLLEINKNPPTGFITNILFTIPTTS